MAGPHCSPWRALPSECGSWNSTYSRFYRWSRAGVWERLFEALSAEPDFEYAIVDATIVRVHQDGTGAKGGLPLTQSADLAAA